MLVSPLCEREARRLGSNVGDEGVDAWYRGREDGQVDHTAGTVADQYRYNTCYWEQWGSLTLT